MTALEEVLDPEIGLNVVDLGLIYQVDFDDTSREIFVSMTLTTQFCPMGESITGSVKHALENAFDDDQVILTLTFQSPWNHTRISEKGLKFLNK